MLVQERRAARVQANAWRQFDEVGALEAGAVRAVDVVMKFGLGDTWPPTPLMQSDRGGSTPMSDTMKSG